MEKLELTFRSERPGKGPCLVFVYDYTPLVSLHRFSVMA